MDKFKPIFLYSKNNLYMIAFQMDEGILIGFSSILCSFDVRRDATYDFFQGY